MPVFETATSSLHYYEYGTGQEILLAFHGYGRRGTQFKVLEKALGQRYRIISFDLFFHGQTKIADDSINHIRKGLQSPAFATQIEDFLTTTYPEVDKVSLLSYSIGTRMAFCLIENIPEKIANVYLIAPDGIEVNWLLKLGGANLILNRVLYKLVYSPKTVNFLSNFIRKFGFVDAAIFRILKAEFSTPETRLKAYNTITYYAQFAFGKYKIAQHINQYHINCHLYFSKKDTLVSSTTVEQFAKLLKNPNLHVFEGGHELVNPAMNNYLADQLSKDDH